MVPSGMLTASSKAKRPGGLQGPRPEPLSVSSLAAAPAEARPSKKPRGEAGGKPAGPVIVYEHTPRVVHARPHEFMAVVQRLTGRRPTSDPPAGPPSAAAAAPPTSFPEVEEGKGSTASAPDSLVLTLGQQRHRPAPPLFDDRSAAAASLVSPTSFLFSPTTIHAIQELTASLF